MLRRNTKEIGDLGERLAVHYLRLHGYTVKERNWRYGHGELDIIAATWRDIVFVEVKTRTRAPETLDSTPPPRAAINREKQRLTRATAQAYLRTHPTKKQPRMDVIELWLAPAPEGARPRVLRCNHIKAAY